MNPHEPHDDDDLFCVGPAPGRGGCALLACLLLLSLAMLSLAVRGGWCLLSH